jgi:hypothetical protein
MVEDHFMSTVLVRSRTGNCREIELQRQPGVFYSGLDSLLRVGLSSPGFGTNEHNFITREQEIGAWKTSRHKTFRIHS